MTLNNNIISDIWNDWNDTISTLEEGWKLPEEIFIDIKAEVNVKIDEILKNNLDDLPPPPKEVNYVL